ncbi:MAG: S9 family peptidase [Gemmatimonadetes bacterium]|nr:S9 family peptidase [Gemmatimonadota bacterium]
MRRAFAIAAAASLSVAAVTPAGAQQPAAKKPITVEASLMLPSWGSYTLSPDGGLIAFTKSERDPESLESTSHIFLYDIASGRTTQLTAAPKGESNPRWLPDGRIVFSSDRDGKSALWVIATTGGEAQKLIDDEKAPANGTFSPDFTRIAFTEASERTDKKEWDERVKKKDDAYRAEKKLTFTHIQVYDIATKTKKRITTGDYDHTGPDWSPDGKWIAFTSNRTGTQTGDPGRSDNVDLFIVPSDSGAERRLTTNAGPDRSPVWSPDGRWIAYTGSDRENHNADQMDLRVISVDGGGPRNLTESLDYSVGGVEWSADGRTIFFNAAQGLTSRAYRVRATGGPVEQQLPDDEHVYAIESRSKDGSRWLVTGTSLGDAGSVYLADAKDDGRSLRLLFHENDGLKDFEVARASTLEWKGADGWTIEGVLTYPIGYTEGQRYPMILQVHGGPHGRFAKTFGVSAQVWAARGYAVLQGNPRGSSGRSFEFSNANVMDWGGKDYQDIMAGVDLVIRMGVADPDRLAVMGGSYGGFMTFWTITQTDRFKAAIGHAGISDWYSFYGQTDIPHLLGFGFGGDPWQTKEVYERFSPIEFAENTTTPLLITHGEEDRRVPITQAEQYYRTLKRLGRTVEFLRFPREGHGIAEPRHRLYLDAEQEAWFAKYVLGQPRPVSEDGRGR